MLAQTVMLLETPGQSAITSKWNSKDLNWGEAQSSIRRQSASTKVGLRGVGERVCQLAWTEASNPEDRK